MKSNADKNLDPLLQLFWKSMLINILICLAIGITVGICKWSALEGILSYFLLLFTLTALVVSKLYQRMAAEFDNYWKSGIL